MDCWSITSPRSRARVTRNKDCSLTIRCASIGVEVHSRVGGSMKICLAGTGAMGEIHVKALAKIQDVEVVSIAARTEPSAKEFASKWNIPFASTDLKACIDRPGVDAVILTTPSD